MSWSEESKFADGREITGRQRENKIETGVDGQNQGRALEGGDGIRSSGAGLPVEAATDKQQEHRTTGDGKGDVERHMLARPGPPREGDVKSST